jgi:beta-glucanase (GH16 family)
VRRPLHALLLAAVLLGAAGAGPCHDESGDELVLVWSDEFEGPQGELPDPAKWGFDVGTDWGNAQLEYDTDRAENVSLDGAGHLVITAREESWLNRQYTSGRINTANRFEQAYGRFEARMRLPVGRGLWPAFWLLGADFDAVGWPACGEIDIMEFVGHEPTIAHAAVHGPGYSGGGAVTGQLDLGRPLSDEFHVFSIEWTPDLITWYVDDMRYHAVGPETVAARGGRWVFDHPFFVILNLAVGGNWPGPPDDTTVFPQTLVVDWVRVYGSEP